MSIIVLKIINLLVTRMMTGGKGIWIFWELPGQVVQPGSIFVANPHKLGHGHAQ